MIRAPRFLPAFMGAALALSALPAEGQLPEAAMRGDQSAVRSLLASGAQVDGAAGDGMTALHWAAERGDVAMARLLIDAGANPELTTRLGAFRPLHLGARSGNPEVVAALLAAGANAAAPTGVAGATPLHYAAISGSADAVRALVRAGAPVEARETEWGQTPLMFAAAGARIEAIEALLDAGADASATAWVLDIPQRENEDRMQRRGDLDAPTPPLSAEARRSAPASGGAARTAIPVAAAGETGGVEPPQEGAAAGYSETVGFMGGLTALLLAVRDGHTETVLTLLERGASLEQPSAGDQTRPLLMATLNGHFDLALLLLERGADPNAVSVAGGGPLYTTLNGEWIPKARHPQPSDYMQQRVSYLELMEALLQAGADPNERLYTELWYTTYTNDLLGVDRRGATPFWRAAHATDVAAMRLLASYGADPSIGTRVNPSRRSGRGGPGRVDPSGLPPLGPDDYGVLPIHASSGVGHGQGYAGNSHRHVSDGWLPAIRYLVEEHGADVNARDLNGYSPLHHAAARGDNELILYLIEHGADPTVVSRRGQTTADMANGPVQRLSPFLETIALLEKLGSKNNHNCVGC